MNYSKVVNLIYIEEIKNQSNKEHVRANVRAYENDIYASDYYANLNRDMQLTMRLKVREIYQRDYLNGQLRYVDYQGKRYTITRAQNTNGKYMYLDIGERI